MRVVLDTNILARAVAAPRGPAREVMQRLFESPHVVVLSEELLVELGRVLRYPRLQALHRLADADIDVFVDSVRRASEVVELETVPPIVPHDSDDDCVVATAVFGEADVLCTLDRHLFAMDVVTYLGANGIRVLTDTQLLRESAHEN